VHVHHDVNESAEKTLLNGPWHTPRSRLGRGTHLGQGSVMAHLCRGSVEAWSWLLKGSWLGRGSVVAWSWLGCGLVLAWSWLGPRSGHDTHRTPGHDTPGTPRPRIGRHTSWSIVDSINVKVDSLTQHALQTQSMEYIVHDKVDEGLKCYSYPEDSIPEGFPPVAACFEAPRDQPEVYPKGFCIGIPGGSGDGKVQCFMSANDALLPVLNMMKGQNDKLCRNFLRDLSMGDTPAETCSKVFTASDGDAGRFDRCCRNFAPSSMPYLY